MIFEIIILGVATHLVFGDLIEAQAEYKRELSRKLERENDLAEQNNGEKDEPI